MYRESFGNMYGEMYFRVAASWPENLSGTDFFSDDFQAGFIGNVRKLSKVCRYVPVCVCVRFAFFFELVGPGLYAMDEKVTMLTLQIGCPIS